MTPEQLTYKLYKELPLASALGLKVLVTEPDRVVLSAPFAPNRNGHGTAFGGSLATLGILGGWAMVHTRLQHDALPASLVIQKSECEYLEPIRTDIRIEARIESGEWAQFLDWYRERGRARVVIKSQLSGGAEEPIAATHTGTYVALGASTH